MKEKIQRLDEVKTEFVSLATHHISTPLTAVKGYVSLIKEDTQNKLSQNSKNIIGDLERVTDRLVTIIRDFLDVNQIDSGKMNYSFTESDLKSILDNVIDQIRPSIERKNISLISKVDGPHFMIDADKNKLGHAFRNILENSIRYMDKGEISIVVNAEAGHYKVTITDTANRKVPIMSPKLTKKFSRDGNENEAKIISQGLGLYVAREIINAHHGAMNIKPSHTAGLQFLIELPSYPVQNE